MDPATIRVRNATHQDFRPGIPWHVTGSLLGLDLALAPLEETNELGSDDTHTVTATILGDPTQVAGILVDFAVTGQYAGTTGDCVPASCLTDAAGQVTFTYSVPVAPTTQPVGTFRRTS